MLTNEQLEQRKKGLGGSDIAAIFGLNEHKTAYELWADKTGRTAPKEETREMHMGNVLEQVVADEFCLATGKKVHKINNTIVHPKYPILLANIDRKVEQESAILECKTASFRTAKEFGAGGTDEVPTSYLLQCMHYLTVTGYESAYLAVLIDGRDFKTYTIGVNESLSNMIIEKAQKFWSKYVVADTPPPAQNEDDLKKLYKTAKQGSCIEATGEIESVVIDLKELKEEASKIEKQIGSKEVEIRGYMGDNEFLLGLNGETLATWKNVTSSRFDGKRFKIACPEMYEKYVKKNTSRMFLAK